LSLVRRVGLLAGRRRRDHRQRPHRRGRPGAGYYFDYVEVREDAFDLGTAAAEHGLDQPPGEIPIV